MKKGFTLLEMIIVLTIAAVLLLLTLPNIQQKKEIIDTQGCQSLIEVVNAQILLYEVNNTSPPDSIDVLIDEGYLKESQKTCPNGLTIEIIDGEAYAN